MKIAFFEIKGWEEKILQKNLKGHDIKYFSESLSIDNIKKAKGFDIISIFIYSQINSAVINKLPRLKLIATRSTGFDHIDIKSATRKKIAVTNVPFYGENTVAEHTFALILSLSRNIHKSYVRIRNSNFSIEGLKGFDLKDKTIGIVGGGHIGLHVARMAKSFAMNVLVYDIHQDDFMSEVLGFKYASLEKLLSQSDIISLHVLYNKYTHHLINRESIKLIKKGALLINTARGAVVDIDALLEALDKKILSGAGLDVVEGEEYIKEEKELLYDTKKSNALGLLAKDHILFQKDNVVFTPHIAFYSQEALERILATTCENIRKFLDNQVQNLLT